MKRCPLTYEEIDKGSYSSQGLKKIHRRLTDLKPLPFSQKTLLHEAALRAPKMSVQGVQPKLSALLKPAQSQFRVVDIKGKYILKPQNPLYAELPENEDLSMHLAKLAGIEIPLHGMVYDINDEFTYFIKRFDREGGKKLPLEDFAQLSGANRETKYNSSVEKVVRIVQKFCTFPRIEMEKLFRRFIFNFLIGNEDMHLKNYSLITRNDIVMLSPGYDFLNSAIVTGSAEESALPIKGKKSKLDRKILFDYLAAERMDLNSAIVEKIMDEFIKIQSLLSHWIEKSFLSEEMKNKYSDLLEERFKRIV